MSGAVPSVGALHPEDPRRVGRFRCVGVLGSGGMGRVFLAFGPDGRAVAVKIVHAHLADVRDFRDRFRREVALSSRVSGAFTAPMVDADPDAERPWLASVYIPGPTLNVAVAQFGPLPTASVRVLAVGLARALREIHRAGLVHRDLKPSNVLLAADGPRVIDFGIARAAEGATALTNAGDLLGSPAYMSPEQALSRPATQASDVYSLGAVVALAAGGRAPFGGPTVPAVLYNVIHAEPELSRVPREFASTLRSCLDRNPARRPDPDAVAAAFAPVPHLDSPWPEPIGRTIAAYGRRTAGIPEPDVIATLPGSGSRPWRRRGLIAGAVAVAVASAATAVVLTRTDSATTSESLEPVTTTVDFAELRTLDACRTLRDALGDGAAVDPGSNGVWGDCKAGVGPTTFYLQLAKSRDLESIDEATDWQVSETGFPVTTLDTGSSLCRVGADLGTDADTVATLDVRTDSADKDLCSRADQALAAILGRIVADPPRADVGADSLSLIDPCTLSDESTLTPIVGRPSPVVVRGLHDCRWEARQSITIRLSADAVPDDPATVRIVDGYEVFENLDLSYSCGLAHRYAVGETWQLVSVWLSGYDDDHERNCATAGAVLATVVPRLG